MPRTKVIGIDPGLVTTGWSILNQESSGIISIEAMGAIKTSSKDGVATRLLKLYKELVAAIKHYEPSCGAIEKTFVNSNSKTSLALAQARGALILSSALMGLELQEYDATFIKKIVTGTGGATKEQVFSMLARQLRGTIPSADHNAVDSAAVAFCHIMAQNTLVQFS